MDDDFLVCERIDSYRSLCISTLSRKTLDEAEASHLGDGTGFYIFEVDNRPEVSGINVLARVASFESALRIISIWQEAVQQPAKPRAANIRPTSGSHKTPLQLA
jgi:hypothetical protein